MKFFPRRIFGEDYYVSVKKKAILCKSSVLFELLSCFVFFFLKEFRRWEIIIASIFYIKLKTDTISHSWC